MRRSKRRNRLWDCHYLVALASIQTNQLCIWWRCTTSSVDRRTRTPTFIGTTQINLARTMIQTVSSMKSSAAVQPSTCYLIRTRTSRLLQRCLRATSHHKRVHTAAWMALKVQALDQRQHLDLRCPTQSSNSTAQASNSFQNTAMKRIHQSKMSIKDSESTRDHKARFRKPYSKDRRKRWIKARASCRVKQPLHSDKT